MIPKINKTYNCFDDGKISRSRLYTVTIKKIIPFNKASKDTLEFWKERVKECYWLFAKETDYFIFVESDEIEENDGVLFIFVRTTDGGWFGIEDWFGSGRLDIDGKLTQIMLENEKL